MKHSIIVLIVSTTFLTTCSQKNIDTEWSLPNDISLQTGDIVFREGNSIESILVMKSDKQSNYSHVGIVCWFENNWQVLHAVPNEAINGAKDTIKMEKIELFFYHDRALSGEIVRTDINQLDTMAILHKCIEIYQQRPIFDNKFDYNDSSRFYCSELIWHIYKSSLNIDLTEGRRHVLPLFPKLIFCSDIYNYSHMHSIYKFTNSSK